MGLVGLGGRLERLPPTAERLEQAHALEQHVGLAVVGAEAGLQLGALRVEQRQQVDLAAVVERPRMAERGVGRRRRNGFRACS